MVTHTVEPVHLTTNPFIPLPHMRGSLAYITGNAVSPPVPAEKPLGNLSIAKSVPSTYGFLWGDLRRVEVNGGWFFHGQGTEAYPSCGEWTHKGCLNEAHPGQAYIKPIKHNCGRGQCLVCHETWLAETTKNIEYRITEAKKLYIKYKWRTHEPIHVTINPAPDLWPLFLVPENFNKLRQKAQQIAKRAGFMGGSIIYHPERSRCGDCGGKLVGKKQEKHCANCGSTNIVWYFSPHWHLFGFGWIRSWYVKRGVCFGHPWAKRVNIAKDTGYIVKNHGVRNSIGATVYYQLSHCGLKEGKQAYTWFGIMHYSKLYIEPMPTEPGETECPICGNRLRLVRYEGTKPPPIEEPGIFDSAGWYYRTEGTGGERQ